MRLGVMAGLVTGGFDDGGQIRTGRAFAVGTADDDERKFRNETKRILDPSLPIEAEIVRTVMQAFQPRQPGIKGSQTLHDLGYVGMVARQESNILPQCGHVPDGPGCSTSLNVRPPAPAGPSSSPAWTRARFASGGDR